MSSHSSALSPRKFCPKEWTDPKRAKFLMTEFRSRIANPEGYDAKMSFWKQNISDWCMSGLTPTFSLSDVRQAFARDGTLPDASCIKRVISEMLRTGDVMRLSEFESQLKERLANGSKNWTSWSLDIVTKPISWGWSMLSSTSFASSEECENDVTDDETFVNLSALSETSNQLLKDLMKSEKIWDLKDLQDKLAEQGIRKQVMQLMLLYWQTEKKAAVVNDSGVCLVKFGADPVFNPVELGLRQLESARELVEKDVRQIESEMDTLLEAVRQALKNNNRSLAIRLLRRKKRLEKRLSDWEAKMDNIDVMEQTLSDSDSNAAIVKTIQQTSDVLKRVQATVRPDEVTDTMDDVEEIIQNHAAVLSDLSRSIDPFTELDGDLEEELEQFLQSDSDQGNRSPKQETGPDVDELMQRLQRLRSPEGSISSSATTQKPAAKTKPTPVLNQ